MDDGPALSQLEMPDIVCLPRHWGILVEYLRQRRYTSGDVEACIGVSRKVLLDWDRGGILDQLYQGLGSGRGDERFGKWRLFSIFELWNLAFYKRLRDGGIDGARVRGVKNAMIPSRQPIMDNPTSHRAQGHRAHERHRFGFNVPCGPVPCAMS